MFDTEVAAAPGSISQVRECTMSIMRLAKADGFTAFVVGHINKEGSIAGPKVLEHMVDCVLYFEGEQSLSLIHISCALTSGSGSALARPLTVPPSRRSLSDRPRSPAFRQTYMRR